MDLEDNDLTSAKACLVRLSLEITQLEQHISANLTLETQPFAQQFSDLRAQIESAIDHIATLNNFTQAGSEPAKPNRDQHWHALKAAIQNYQNFAPSMADQTRHTK